MYSISADIVCVALIDNNICSNYWVLEKVIVDAVGYSFATTTAEKHIIDTGYISDLDKILRPMAEICQTSVFGPLEAIRVLRIHPFHISSLKTCCLYTTVCKRNRNNFCTYNPYSKVMMIMARW